MAKAFPKSQFCGFDLHPTSIEAANRHAKEQQITNVNFSIATAKDFPGNDYGFVTVFDALHDMGDPIGAASHVKQSLQADGTFMIVEPFAGDSLAENMSPVGQALALPLMAGLANMVYNPRAGEKIARLPDPGELCKLRDREEVEARLFDSFIAAAYRSARRRQAKRAIKWLAYLARHLERTQPLPHPLR